VRKQQNVTEVHYEHNVSTAVLFANGHACNKGFYVTHCNNQKIFLKGSVNVRDC